jgi:hypothetical protein
MAFENSPKLGNPSKTARTLSGWVFQFRFLLVALTGILIVSASLFLINKKFMDQPALPTGGLDGCLVDRMGTPMMATVRVDQATASTYEDGCFFFSILTPGEHQFQVVVEENIVYVQTVNILSDQALGLGTIQIEP